MPNPEPQKIPGGAEKFRASKIYKKTLAEIPNIDQLLKNNGALIAGGSVLGALLERNWGSDMDIYVPIPNDKSIHALFREEFLESTTKRYKSSEYCSSFMRKNGIRTVVNYIAADYNIDVMAVRKRTTPLQVVQNFDLTFCQVWYDGEDVWATHPEHIQNKSGELQGEYVPVYFSGNFFLRKRMRKYLFRGFTIRADVEGVEATKKLLDDFGSMSNSFCHFPVDFHNFKKELARKTLFRACIRKNKSFVPIRQYIEEEDGYDSDDYVEDSQKLIDFAGSMDTFLECVHDYFIEIGKHFSEKINYYDDIISTLDRTYITPLIVETIKICGQEYKQKYGYSINIDIHGANSNHESNRLYEPEYENENENQYYNENENEEIPEASNKPIETREMPIPNETECFDPYMASMVDVADNQVLFYIYNSENQFKSVACIDNESEENGQTVLLYKKFLEPDEYVYYKCLPSVPQGALFIGLDQIEPEPLRRLAFDKNIYVYEGQIKHIQAGHKYALIPTQNKVGRIVSKRLLQSGDAVSADHCQSDNPDLIHELFEIVAPVQGGAIRLRKIPRKKTNALRNTFKNRSKAKKTGKTRNRKRSRKNK